MITRCLESTLKERLGQDRAIIVFGARQVGKTTVLKSLFAGQDSVLWLNADEQRVRTLFDDVSTANFAPYLAGYDTVVLDEAQRIDDIGLKLKILQDGFGATIQFVATGSSSFDLANKVNETLTGRKWDMQMYPLTVGEMVAHHGLFYEEAALDTRLVFGWYPEVVSRPDLAMDILTELSGSNLYKDIFTLREIRRSDAFERLVQALAYQIGSQVNFTELGSLVGLDKKTVATYIDMLEQAFIIFRLKSYSRNLRNELSTSSKVYFYDVGLRNAIISNFDPAPSRSDIGGLFENFVIAELVKRDGRSGIGHHWFWRTTNSQEVDYLNDSGPDLNAVEVKWNPATKAKLPPTFADAYPGTTLTVITRSNVVRLLADQGDRDIA